MVKNESDLRDGRSNSFVAGKKRSKSPNNLERAEKDENEGARGEEYGSDYEDDHHTNEVSKELAKTLSLSNENETPRQPRRSELTEQEKEEIGQLVAVERKREEDEEKRWEDEDLAVTLPLPAPTTTTATATIDEKKSRSPLSFPCSDAYAAHTRAQERREGRGHTLETANR